MIKRIFNKYTIIVVMLICVIIMISTLLFTKRIEKVEVNNQNMTFDISTFQINDLQLKIIYDNKEKEIIDVDTSMVSLEDLEKLNKPGTHIITIFYKEFTINNVEIILCENMEDRVVQEINVLINEEKYTILSESQEYDVTCTSDANYEHITIKVVLKKGYKFSNDSLCFYKNNKLISKDKYTIINNELIYIYDDPNWSKIY